VGGGGAKRQPQTGGAIGKGVGQESWWKVREDEGGWVAGVKNGEGGGGGRAKTRRDVEAQMVVG